jgi:4-methylaminobutanoate oxidase (formaldehyde-forming)
LTVYDALVVFGAEHGLGLAGYRAIDSLRLEKFYRAWGADIGPDHTPLEAGLGAFVKLKKETAFLGRAALETQAAKPVKKMLCGFTTPDENAVLLGRETIYRNNIRVGWLACGGFGHTVGRPIGYGYVRNPYGLDRAYVEAGSYELEVATQRIPANVFLEPLFDPGMVRVKG